MQILGVNEAGHESGNDSICSGRDLPWLQEAADRSVWDEWGVAYRDVYVLDIQNVVIHVYNLTANNLADSAKYDELKGLIRDLASN